LELLQTHRVIRNDKDVANLQIKLDTTIEPRRVRVEIRALEEEAA
jgi:hypothetical protein